MKTRREVLQGMIISIGGASMLNACGGAASIAPSVQSQGNHFYTKEERALVSRLSDLIIPRTDTPGALDVNVPGFLDSLMAEWANARTQRNHHQYLVQIEAFLGQDFVNLADPTAIPLLERLDTAAFSGDDSYPGYRSVKGLITQAYFASEEGALLERKWVATPGRWDSCVDIV